MTSPIPWGPRLAVLLLAATVMVGNVGWLMRDSRPPNSDQNHHFTKCHGFYERLQKSGSALEVLTGWVRYPTTYPPLGYVTTSLTFALVGGYSTRVAVMSFLGFWLVLVVYTYRAGKLLWSWEGGLWAALLAATSPLMTLLSRKYFLEFPLAALVVAALYYLMANRGFASRRRAVLCGLFVGAGLMVKWSFAIYVGGALAVAASIPLRQALRGSALSRLVVIGTIVAFAALIREIGCDSPPFATMTATGMLRVLGLVMLVGLDAFVVAEVLQRGVRDPALNGWLNLLCAAAVAWCVAAPWYLPHAKVLFGYGPQICMDVGYSEHDPSATTMTGWLYYLFAIKNTQFQPFYYMFLVGLGVAAWTARRHWERGVLVAAFGAFYLAGTIVVNKEARYFSPMIPVVALLATFWLPTLRRARWGLVGLIVPVCLLQTWGWALHDRVPAGRAWYFTSDNITAGAKDLPGGDSINFHDFQIGLPDLVIPKPYPFMGMPPEKGTWNEWTVLKDVGP